MADIVAAIKAEIAKKQSELKALEAALVAVSGGAKRRGRPPKTDGTPKKRGRPKKKSQNKDAEKTPF